jgi:Methyltransferase domain
MRLVRRDSPKRRSVPESRLCTQQELESEGFQKWADLLREPHLLLHRKIWEWCFITRVLEEQGMLAAGRRGLGFAVGREPLVAQYAACGASIVATDLDVDHAAEAGWVGSGEHAASLAVLNERAICPQDVFDRSVRFQEVNMLDIPTELRDFDFVWSSCAFEHLGSLQAGVDFVVSSMDCLRPGGLAVHTTEFNVGSNDATMAVGGTVIYRERDI